MVGSLEKAQKDFWDAVIERYENGEWWRFTINLVLVVGGGVLVGLGKLELFAEPHGSWITGVGLAMVFVGGLLAAIFDRRRAGLTSSARAAIDLAQSFTDDRRLLESQIRAAEQLDSRRRHLLLAQFVMLEAAERVPISAGIVTVIEAMLDAGSNDLEGAIGFEAGERWTFSIFQRGRVSSRSKAEVMRRIAFVWAERSMEKRPAREWRKKEGFTGVSWQRDDEVIEADVLAPGVVEQYPVSLEMQKPDDNQRYVSVAVIPIRVGRDDDMWGSVTATSDRAGRWRREASNPGQQNVMAVRLLAQLIATQVALREGVATETL